MNDHISKPIDVDEFSPPLQMGWGTMKERKDIGRAGLICGGY